MSRRSTVALSVFAALVTSMVLVDNADAGLRDRVKALRSRVAAAVSSVEPGSTGCEAASADEKGCEAKTASCQKESGCKRFSVRRFASRLRSSRCG